MDTNLGSNYPVIDKFEDGVATSIKSRDLTAKSYQNGKTLERTIKNDIDKLNQFELRNWGDKYLLGTPIDSKKLTIVVPNTKLHSDQINAINNSISYAKQYNIKIEIIVGR